MARIFFYKINYLLTTTRFAKLHEPLWSKYVLFAAVVIAAALVAIVVAVFVAIAVAAAVSPNIRL